MDRRTGLTIAAVVVALMALLVIMGGGGIPRSTLALVEAESRSVSEDERRNTMERAEIERALSTEATLFSSQGLDATWKASLTASQKRLAEADAAIAKAQELCETDDREQVAEVERLVASARAARLSSRNDVNEILLSARSWIDLKKNLKSHLGKIESDFKAIESADIAASRALVAKAVVDWPEKKPDLEKRIAALEKIVSESRTSWATSAQNREAATRESFEGVDFQAIKTLQTSFEESRKSLAAAPERLRALVDQLYWSWDKILVDQEIREGREVTFHQKFQKIKTRALDAVGEVADAKAETKTEESLVTVPSATFKAMEGYLGMVVEHKDAGKYDHESEKVVQPPGYAYMCPPEQKSNRYGHWQNRGGTSFWVFYGQYALMRDVFWGRSRDWVTPGSYRGYRGSRDTGRTYYGKDSAGRSRFGKEGTLTKTRYNSSKYVSTGGFKNSKYVKSGGTYRGSKYSSSSRSSSYGSSRSSSSRSGSGFSTRRSSSSRSSFGGSRFGGGK